MFIYSKYSNFGVEEPGKLVNLLANEGIQGVCLIDEFGLGIPSFLKGCIKRRLKASIAIPFTSFIEGMEGKCDGYLVATTGSSYEAANFLIEKIKKDFISLLKTDDIKEMSALGVYCLVRNGASCFEYLSKVKIKVAPIAYGNEYIKSRAMKKTETTIGISMEADYFIPETLIFVEGISKDPSDFLAFFEKNNKCVDINLYKEKKSHLDQPQKNMAFTK